MLNKRPLLMMFLLFLIVLILTACSQATPSPVIEQQSAKTEEHIDDEEEVHGDEGEEEHMDEEAAGDEHVEGDEHEHIDPPTEFASLTNPVDGDDEVIKAGMAIFETNCASCHGSEGLGDGPAAAALDPTPASLADTDMMNELSDGYLFWRVSEGGVFDPFNSVMPAWKNTLSEDERWQVISYIRTLSNGD